MYKLYTKKVTSCLNCPHVWMYKNEYRCQKVIHRKNNPRLIRLQKDRYIIPEWCPLEDCKEA